MKHSLGIALQQSRNASGTALSFAKLVVLISDYIATSAQALQMSPHLPQASIQVRLLAVTLASTRLRTKLALDALSRFSGLIDVTDQQLVLNGVADVLAQVDEQLARESSVEGLIHQIVQIDHELIQALQAQSEDQRPPSEELGQLVVMVTMMRRACFFIFNAES